MTLDRNNYEAWLLDRMEGNLSAEQEALLDAFLLANPDLADDGAPLPQVEDNGPDYPGKEALHRSFPPKGDVDLARLDDFLIARAEGDLDARRIAQLEALLRAHPALDRTARIVAAARIAPEPTIFQGKGALGRTVPPTGTPDRHRLTDFLIAAAEGDLDPVRSRTLDALVNGDRTAERERRLVAATKVRPGTEVYPHKEQLRKKAEPRVIPLWQRLAVAASVLLALTAVIRFASAPATGPSGVAHVEPPAVVPSMDSARQAPTAPATERPSEVTAPAQTSPSLEHEGQRPMRMQRPANEAVPQALPGQKQVAPTNDPQPQPVAKDPAPRPLPEPALVPEPAHLVAVTAPTPTAPGADAGTTHTLGNLLANTVRNDVLGTEERPADLDRKDAVALVDKSIGALTSGTGGVEVQRTQGRKRVLLRLGGGVEIMASTAR